MMSTINLQLGGKNLEFPTEEHLRCFLLDAAEYFHRRTGIPRTTIGTGQQSRNHSRAVAKKTRCRQERIRAHC
jgi:hypothetical protein